MNTKRLLNDSGPLERYGTGALHFARIDSGLYGSHLLPQQTHTRKVAKRIYYRSMEFLIRRSLANNVTNLLLGPVVNETVWKKNLDWIELREQQPDAVLRNGGLGRLAACLLESMAQPQVSA